MHKEWERDCSFSLPQASSHVIKVVNIVISREGKEEEQQQQGKEEKEVVVVVVMVKGENREAGFMDLLNYAALAAWKSISEREAVSKKPQMRKINGLGGRERARQERRERRKRRRRTTKSWPESWVGAEGLTSHCMFHSPSGFPNPSSFRCQMMPGTLSPRSRCCRPATRRRRNRYEKKNS